ncbi:MAG: ferredoxin, partial [Myxococcales bacterium]|nr:ferredoxin [Myxococcales bacterium]
APAAAPAAPAPAADTTSAGSGNGVPAAAAVADDDEDDDGGFDEPWVDSMLCTTCNDCTNLNPLLFAYNDNKQAFIKDPKAGTFAQLVTAAEACPARCIHPGKPLDADEPGLDELIERARPFN